MAKETQNGALKRATSADTPASKLLSRYFNTSLTLFYKVAHLLLLVESLNQPQTTVAVVASAKLSVLTSVTSPVQSPSLCPEMQTHRL